MALGRNGLAFDVREGVARSCSSRSMQRSVRAGLLPSTGCDGRTWHPRCINSRPVAAISG